MAAQGPYYGVSILRTDIIHVVDALRALCGDAKEVVAHVDHQHVRWEGSYNLFNALIRFEANRQARWAMHVQGLAWLPWLIGSELEILEPRQ